MSYPLNNEQEEISRASNSHKTSSFLIMNFRCATISVSLRQDIAAST